MTRRWVLGGIAVSLLVLLALVFTYPHQMIAPGNLVPAHRAITDNCFACHAPLRGASPDKCIACHALPDIGVRTTKGKAIPQSAGKTAFHQALAEQNCMACHSDHAGPMLTQRSRNRFAHNLLKPDMQARCETCHTAPRTAVHRGIDMGCAQCHSVAGWTPATFDHDRFFKLDGDHKAPCVTCHVNAVYTRYTCFGCHEHQPGPIRALHAEEGIRNIDNCVRCHRSSSDEGRDGEGRGEREGSDDD